MKRGILLGAIGLGLVAIALAITYLWQTSKFRTFPGSTFRNTIRSAGERRRFLLHMPASYRSGEILPLVLNFHGYESNAAQQERISEMSLLADSAGFIVVYPEGLGHPQAWQTGLEGLQEVDRLFIRDLLQLLETRLNIDPNRIYAVGISNGAQMAVRLGCEMADRFAAIGVVSGSYPAAGTCAPAQPVPLIAFHGTADKSLPFEGGPLPGGVLMPARQGAAEWAERNGCSTSPKLTYQNGSVIGETWSPCQGNAEVSFYAIQDGGHTWPGSGLAGSNTAPIYDVATQDIEAAQAIWDFFAAHPKP